MILKNNECSVAVIDAAGASHPGALRHNNEDRVLVRVSSSKSRHGDLALMAVADGVGGGPAGELASATAVDVLARGFDNLNGEADPQKALRRLYRIANAQILANAKGDATRSGMATTLVTVLIRDSQMWIANVGDSRIYHLRACKLVQLTRDHSLAVEGSSIPFLRRLARRPEAEHILMRSLGGATDARPDLSPIVDLFAGDKVLLCSDGLYDVLSKKDLAAYLQSEGVSSDSIAKSLVEQAVSQGATDNVSAIVLQVETCSEHRES